MDRNLTCNQVSALISFYLNDKLNPKLKGYFEQHLANCPACAKKVRELKTILSHYKKNKMPTTNKSNSNELIRQLSAYVDNELSQNENIKIKKITISNPAARQELETMYKFRKIMHSAYEKTKSDSKFDYSKNIASKIYENSEYSTDYFYKLAAIFVILIGAIITGFIYLYF